MTKAKDLRSIGTKELRSKLIELRKDLIKHNAQIATGTTPKSPGQVREIKKTIAKIMAIVSERKNEPKPSSESEKSLESKVPKTEEE